MESSLSWTLNNANYCSITVLFCTDSKSLVSRNSINSISSSGFLVILPSLVTISLIRQPKKPPPLPRMPLPHGYHGYFLFLSLALFKSLTRQFVTLHQQTNGLLLSTNIDGLLRMQNRSTTEEMTS